MWHGLYQEGLLWWVLKSYSQNFSFNVCDKCVSCLRLVLKEQKVNSDLPQFWPCHKFVCFFLINNPYCNGQNKKL